MAPSDRLSSPDFLSKLTELFQKTHTATHGSVFLTQKPLPPPQSQSEPSNPSLPTQILIRASNGKSKEHRTHKVKLSTVVAVSELDDFYTKYAEVCKSGMSGLRKRDRRKGKAKDKKKRKGGKAEKSG